MSASKDNSWDPVKNTYISQLDNMTYDLAASLMSEDDFGHCIELPAEIGLDDNWDQRQGFQMQDESTVGGVTANMQSVATFHGQQPDDNSMETYSNEVAPPPAPAEEYDDHTEMKDAANDDNPNENDSQHSTASRAGSDGSFHSVPNISDSRWMQAIAQQSSTYDSPQRKQTAPSSRATAGTASLGGTSNDP